MPYAALLAVATRYFSDSASSSFANGRRAEQAPSPPGTKCLWPIAGSSGGRAGISSRRRRRACARHFRATRPVGKMNACVSVRGARAKELAMMMPSTPVATPSSLDSTNTAKAATVEASARSAFRAQLQAAAANEERVANLTAAAAAARRATTEIPDPMTSLSTVAVAGAMNSLPAALNMMRNIAMASASGTLSDADRLTLQTEYAQLTAKVVSSVGSVSTGEQAQQSTAHDDEREDNAENTWREDSDDRRSTLTRTVEQPKQTVQYLPVERTVTTQKQALVPDGHGPQRDPQVDFRTHELHVGTDSYEPVSMRQSMEHPTTPETFGRIESHAETTHTFVAKAAQITQFVQVAQTEHVAPVVAVA